MPLGASDKATPESKICFIAGSRSAFWKPSPAAAPKQAVVCFALEFFLKRGNAQAECKFQPNLCYEPCAAQPACTEQVHVRTTSWTWICAGGARQPEESGQPLTDARGTFEAKYRKALAASLANGRVRAGQ